MICRFIYTCALYFLYVYVDVIRRVVIIVDTKI